MLLALRRLLALLLVIPLLALGLPVLLVALFLGLSGGLLVFVGQGLLRLVEFLFQGLQRLAQTRPPQK